MKTGGAILFAMCCAVGCQDNSPGVDVGGRAPEFPCLRHGYEMNSVYETTTALLVEGEKGVGALRVPGEGMPSVAMLQTAPGKHPRVKGVADTGTRLRITGLYSKPARGSLDRRVSVRAVILAGPYSGWTVSLDTISTYRFGTELGILPIPDPKTVRKLELAED